MAILFPTETGAVNRFEGRLRADFAEVVSKITQKFKKLPYKFKRLEDCIALLLAPFPVLLSRL